MHVCFQHAKARQPRTPAGASVQLEWQHLHRDGALRAGQSPRLPALQREALRHAAQPDQLRLVSILRNETTT